MYYMGGTFEETKMGDYMTRELPESLKDATIQGMKMRIGVALSQDGISWGRVEGDDPTGACMVPFDRSDPNVEQDEVPKDFPEEMYCAWPEVSVNLDGDESETFFMFYSTMTKIGKQKSIAYAVSTDGFRWFKKGIALKPDQEGLDAGGCARCCVVRDAVYREDMGVWEEVPGWKMFYEGVSIADNKHRIMGAESRDGHEWTKTGLVMDVGVDGAWDCNGVGSPNVVRYVRSDELDTEAFFFLSF